MEFLTASYCETGGEKCALVLQHYAYKGEEVIFACIVEEGGILDGAPAENRKVADGAVEENRMCCYFAERLLEEFRKYPVFSALKKPEKYIEWVACVFEEVIEGIDREVSAVRESGCVRQPVRGKGKKNEKGEIPVSGVFCVGGGCFMFARGDMSVLLLNRDRGKPCATPLRRGERGLCIKLGRIEPGVGVLLATGDFLRGIGERELQEGLFVEDLLRPIYLHGQERKAKLTRNSGKRNHRRGSVRQSEMEDRYRQEYMVEKHLRELGLAGTVRKSSAGILILTKEAEVK